MVGFAEQLPLVEPPADLEQRTTQQPDRPLGGDRAVVVTEPVHVARFCETVIERGPILLGNALAQGRDRGPDIAFGVPLRPGRGEDRTRGRLRAALPACARRRRSSSRSASRSRAGTRRARRPRRARSHARRRGSWASTAPPRSAAPRRARGSVGATDDGDEPRRTATTSASGSPHRRVCASRSPTGPRSVPWSSKCRTWPSRCVRERAAQVVSELGVVVALDGFVLEGAVACHEQRALLAVPARHLGPPRLAVHRRKRLLLAAAERRVHPRQQPQDHGGRRRCLAGRRRAARAAGRTCR